MGACGSPVLKGFISISEFALHFGNSLGNRNFDGTRAGAGDRARGSPGSTAAIVARFEGASRGWTRGFLVSSQVCLAFVLTVCFRLLLKSFVLVWRVNPGFNVQNLYEVNFFAERPEI